MTSNNVRIYKFDPLPEGYSKLARAVWMRLGYGGGLELYDINGKLVFTDDVDRYLKVDHSDAHEFSSHQEFERFLIKLLVEWSSGDPAGWDEIESVGKYITLTFE